MNRTIEQPDFIINVSKSKSISNLIIHFQGLIQSSVQKNNIQLTNCVNFINKFYFLQDNIDDEKVTKAMDKDRWYVGTFKKLLLNLYELSNHSYYDKNQQDKSG